VKITFDPAKRRKNLDKHGLDLADADKVFADLVATAEDLRNDYGERRYISAGYLSDRMVVMVWTPRSEARHVISMRYCHAKEQERWRHFKPT
jgi:uncharacterized DUF497 family protein